MKSRSVGSASSPRAALLSLALDTVVVADDRRFGLSLMAEM